MPRRTETVSAPGAADETWRPPAIGLVLGGGGIAGYAFHCAVLEALKDEIGFDARTADIILGTSAGAIASALLRAGTSAAELRARLASAVDSIDGTTEDGAILHLLTGRSSRALPRIWAGPGSPSLAVQEIRRGRRIRPTRLVAGLLPLGRRPLDPVGGALAELHGDGWPAEPLWITATELRTGRLAVFGRDERPPIALAAQASAAVPALFAPVRINGVTYMDGGVASPFHAYLLAEPIGVGGRRLDLVVVLAPLSIRALDRATPISTVARSVPRRVLRRELDQLHAAGIETMVLQPDRPMVRAMGLNPMDPDRIPAVVDGAHRLVEHQLATASAQARQWLAHAGSWAPPPRDDAKDLSE